MDKPTPDELRARLQAKREAAKTPPPPATPTPPPPPKKADPLAELFIVIIEDMKVDKKKTIELYEVGKSMTKNGIEFGDWDRLKAVGDDDLGLLRMTNYPTVWYMPRELPRMEGEYVVIPPPPPLEDPPLFDE